MTEGLIEDVGVSSNFPQSGFAGGYVIGEVLTPTRRGSQPLLPPQASRLPRAKESVILIKEFWSHLGVKTFMYEQSSCMLGAL